MSVSIAALSSPAARSSKGDKDKELQQSPSEEDILLGSVSEDSIRENESGPLSSSRDGSHSRSPMQSKHVAPDFKRRQLIFDSFTKLKQANAMNQRGQMTQLAGPKGTLLYTWGAGYHGQLGLSSYRKKCKLIPAWIDFKEAVLQVSCGGFHTAVLTDTGQVYTWGDGRYGQLGNLARKHNMLATPHLVDRLVQFDVTVVQISCGQYHTAAVGSRGELYSWGSGKHGQLGHGTRLDERYPRRVEMDSITAPVAASGNGAAAATALDAANTLAITAKAGSGPVTFMQVSCGDRHTAAVTRRNQVVTFGSGQHGQLGHGNGWDFLKPKLVEALIEERITEVNAGSTTTCALTDQGVMYLWGFGESIHPKEMSNIIDTPRIVKMKERVKQVACGQSHILMLTESGDVYAFGSGGMGQIGHGSVSGVRAPRLVLKGKDISEIAAGRYHSMAVTAFGVLYSWGCGESGQLAHNSLENEHLPRVVEAILPNVVGQICCGEHHSFCLSSIEHASIAADVQQWLLIEQEELQLKQSLARKHPNGLKSRHVLQVEQERVKIEANIRAGLKKEKEEEKKYLIEQLESINGRDSILDDVQKRAQAKLNSLQGVPGGIAGMAAASGLSEADAAVLAITAPDALVEAVAANSANLPHDFNMSSNQGGVKVKSKKNKRRTNAFAESTDPSANISLMLSPLPEAKNLNGSKSSPAIGRQSISALAGSQLRKWMAANNSSSLSDHEEDPLAESPTHAHVPVLNKKKISQLHHSEGLDSDDSLQQPHDDGKARPSTSPGEGALVPVGDNTAVTASTTALGYGFNSGFQPLASRVNFMEKTTTSLARMKKFLQTGGAARLLKQAGAVLPPTSTPDPSNPIAAAPEPIENELFAWKKQFNEIHATVKARQQQLEALRNSYSYMRPSDEDQARSSVWQSHIRELNMKLVTLNTRLMEADENKKNYELYIMRMKEEDVQLSKQIDHLRHLVQEYDRLLSKMGRMNTRVSAQKIQIDEEILRFAKDITEFDAFAQELLGRYESLVNTSQQQAIAFAQQIQKQQQRRKSSSGLCVMPPFDNEQLAIEAPRQEGEDGSTMEPVPISQSSAEANVWQENVQFYEQRFHKIVAATGLVNADDIINKYFVNDEIKADLATEVDKLRRNRDQLLRERSELNTSLEEQKGNFVQSKWRDVDTLQGRLADEKLRLTRRREDTDRVMQHLTFVREGAMALLHAVDETCGTSSVPEVNMEETDPNYECAQTIQWLKAMEERLTWLSDQIQKTNKAKKKKAQAQAAAAAAAAAANLGAYE